MTERPTIEKPTAETSFAEPKTPETGPIELASERGSVLLIALLMLVVFTLVGATFLTLSNTEGMISTNHTGSVQSLFVAESAAQLAYESLAASNFQSFTHQADGSPQTIGTLTPVAFPGTLTLDDAGVQGFTEERDDGWYVWEWNPGDPDPSLTNTGLLEQIRFSVRPASADPNDSQFVIEVEGVVGRFRKRLQVLGYSESIFTYAVFSDGPLTEFTRGEDQTITGKIHANGDLFMRPADPRTLTINSPSLTATGRIVRTTDLFGRDLFSGGSTVLIDDNTGTPVEMVLGAPGTAMDSDNPNWTNDDPNDGIDGALELWGGVVRDGQLGAVHIDPPPVETIVAGGWYDQRAGLRLSAGDTQTDELGNDVSAAIAGAVTEVTFWNDATEEYETVQEIDMAALNASGYFPPNGLLYSDVPIRLVNASELNGDLTIACAHNVYTRGDFNTTNKRPAAILSRGRIWHLSDAWNDSDSVTQGATSGRQAQNGTTTINAAMLDGQPAMGTGQWADIDGDGTPDDPTAGDASPDADFLLESWGGSRTLRKYGSIVHLQNADMADSPDNAGKQPWEISWITNGAYAPPSRDYSYDPALAGLTGQPPFTPMTGRIFLWQEISP